MNPKDVGSAQHTPGPWSRVPQSDGSTLIARRYETGNQMRPTGLRIIGFTMARSNSLAEDEANACLFAAAPELLSLLEDAVAFTAPHVEGGEADEWVIAARAAIAKASGAAS